MRAALLSLLFITVAAGQDLVREVRTAIAQNNFAAGEALIGKYKATAGTTPEMIEAVSWLGRGALAAKQFDRAQAYASETRKLVLEELKRRPLDAEPHLPNALGASIEAQAQAMAARGERDQAVQFLRAEVKAWWSTSIRTRIQKNIHLLSLEGKPAPALDVSRWLGPKPPALSQLHGKTVLLFFWAHWCADCKRQAADVVRVASEYGPKGLVVIGPTRRYGYVAGGVEAPPEKETAYIESVRQEFYAALARMPAPLSEENFKNYGSSSSPTLVLVDRQGIVRMYHPGAMSYSELASAVQAAL
ncbi:MAG TPA: TlpA disulfide reductase family protein [Bryobacteraceae bacterium]|nr:TlpA disulfide reductase family protein [Bryobacteraceae bacterium]